MKKLIKILVMALSLGVIYIAVDMFLYENEKVSAINEHASFLANKENIEYISLAEERKAKAEAEKKAAEEERARKEEEKKKQEEEKKKLEEQNKEEQKVQENVTVKVEKPANNSKILEVELINQLPEYKNGCEATSLTMLLNYAGVTVDKDTVVSKMKKDATEVKYDGRGNILEWGDPRVGFVGDVTGKKPGYSIDPIALKSVIEEYLPGKSLDLTGCEFYKLQEILYTGRPIVVWVNKTFEEPKVSYTWTSARGEISAFKNQHAVVLTGYDENNFYYNDPLTEEKNASISKEVFKGVWIAMGSKALSYYK